MDDDTRAGAPAWILLASGIVHLLYSVTYACWTLLPILWSASVYFSAWLNGEGLDVVITGLIMTMIVPLVQLFCFVLACLASAVVIWGGVRLNQYRSKGLVWLAVLSTVAIPFLCLLVNAGSAVNLGSLGMGCITGCLLGNIPTLVTLVIGIVGAAAGIVGVTSPTAAEAFARG
jgi:hypothetical protein